MADTHCELCNQRFTAEERLVRETIHSHGGVGYAHPACKELSNRIYALVLCLAFYRARRIDDVGSELDRIKASDDLRTHIFGVLRS